MANQHKDERVVELDKPRMLKLDFNSFCEAESLLGHPVLRKDLGLLEIRALLWAGLKHEDKKLTPEKIGEMLTSANFAAVTDIVAEAVGDFFAVGEAAGAGATPTG